MNLSLIQYNTPIEYQKNCSFPLVINSNFSGVTNSDCASYFRRLGCEIRASSIVGRQPDFSCYIWCAALPRAFVFLFFSKMFLTELNLVSVTTTKRRQEYLILPRNLRIAQALFFSALKCVLESVFCGTPPSLIR